MNQTLSRRRTMQRPPERNCRLLNLPDEILLHVLGFTMLAPKESDSTEVWRWVGQIRCVCRIFRSLGRYLAPSHLWIGHNENSQKTSLLVSLIRSFRDTPWKGAKIKAIDYRGFHDSNRNHQNWRHLSDNRRILEALRSLFDTPRCLPRVIFLSFQIYHDGGIIDAEFLFSLARNLPNLRDLQILDGFQSRGYFPLGERVTAEQFGIFARMIKRPMSKVKFEFCRLTEAHVDAFLTEKGQSLINLSFYQRPLLRRGETLTQR